MPRMILCGNCGSGNVNSKYIWDEDGTLAIQVNCKICGETTVIREAKKYEKPRILAQGEAPVRPCRPNHMPSGRPCYPPAPGNSW